jgi:hypothetical protein
LDSKDLKPLLTGKDLRTLLTGTKSLSLPVFVVFDEMILEMKNKKEIKLGIKIVIHVSKHKM